MENTCFRKGNNRAAQKGYTQPTFRENADHAEAAFITDSIKLFNNIHSFLNKYNKTPLNSDSFLKLISSDDTLRYLIDSNSSHLNSHLGILTEPPQHTNSNELISDQLKNIRTENRRLMCILDQCSDGAILLNKDLELYYANREAKRVLAAEEGLRLAGERVLAPDSFNKVLKKSISELIEGKANHDLVSEHIELILPRNFNKPPLTIEVMSIDAGGEVGVSKRDDAVLVFITDPLNKVPSIKTTSSWFFKNFGLTKQQAHTAALALQGLSIDHMAEIGHKGRETIRSHLKSSFKKLGVKSQIELIRNFAYSVPLRNKRIKDNINNE